MGSLGSGLRDTLKMLEQHARGAGVEVRWDRGVGRGGLCRVGTRVMIVGDAGLPVGEKIVLLAQGLEEHGVVLPEGFVRPSRARTVRRVVVEVPPARTTRGPRKAVPRPLPVESESLQVDRRRKC